MTRQDKEKISPDKINPAGQNKFHRLELIQLYMVWCFLLLSLFNLWNALKPKNILSVGWTRLMFFPPVERWLLYHVHRVDHVLFTYICKTSFNPPWAALAAHFFWAAEIAFLECNRKLGQRFALTECRRTVNPELICQEHVQHIQRESQRVFWLDNAITFRPDLFVYRPQEDPSSDSVTQKKKIKKTTKENAGAIYIFHIEKRGTLGSEIREILLTLKLEHSDYWNKNTAAWSSALLEKLNINLMLHNVMLLTKVTFIIGTMAKTSKSMFMSVCVCMCACIVTITYELMFLHYKSPPFLPLVSRNWSLFSQIVKLISQLLQFLPFPLFTPLRESNRFCTSFTFLF